MLGLLAALAVLGGTARGTTRPTVVLVGDSAIRPLTALAPVRTTVVWRNAGNHAHRIASTTRAWTAFSIGPGARHAVKFRRAGRFPYVVDGTRKGLLVVGRRGAGGLVRGVYTVPYDVAEEVTTQYARTTDHSTQTSTVHWLATWPNLALHADVTSAALTVFNPAATASLAAHEAFSWQDSQLGVSCSGAVDVTEPANLVVSGGWSLSLIPQAESTAAASTPQTFADAVTQKQQSSCGGNAFGIPSWSLGASRTLQESHGVELEPDESAVALHWEHDELRADPRIPYPLVPLARGASLSLNPPALDLQESCGVGCTVSSRTEVRVTFTARTAG